MGVVVKPKKVISFTYRKLDGTLRDVERFTVDSVYSSQAGHRIIAGYREDGEGRSYRRTRMTNVQEHPEAPLYTPTNAQVNTVTKPADGEADTPVKRGPGRPRKNPEEAATAPRRGPGRPRKNPEEAATAPRRGPGRPRKNPEEAATAPRRGPGRPRKVTTSEVPASTRRVNITAPPRATRLAVETADSPREVPPVSPIYSPNRTAPRRAGMMARAVARQRRMAVATNA